MHENASPKIDHCYLEVLDDVGRVVKVVKVAEEATIGRASEDQTPDIVVPPECQSASRRHAVLGFSEGRPVLTDSSRFGTIVNDHVILGQSVALEEGDLIVFGWRSDGWRVQVRFGKPPDTVLPDPLEMLVVSPVPRQVKIGPRPVDEHLGDRAFRLLQILAANKGQWFPIGHLVEMLWPIPEDAPAMPNQALSKYKKAINDLLWSHLDEQDAIEMRPYQGYRMKVRLEPNEASHSGPA